ncbi:hypothetical protein I4U23_021969 [Adineta vaga]|nr:hypothetical protein I4U23_021969 [Adineta vaga]
MDLNSKFFIINILNTTYSLSCVSNICQNNGQCFLFNLFISNFTCICPRCYKGSVCEIEKYSQNLWYLSIGDDKRFSNHQMIETIVGLIISILAFILNCLMLPLVFTLCIMPYFILTQIVTCSSADNFVIGKLITILEFLLDLVLIIPFLTTILPSKLYMEHFWEISYFGRFLIYIKTKLCKRLK